MKKIKEIPLTYEEFSDSNSPIVVKYKGIALGRKEKAVFKKVNEIVREVNKIGSK